MLRAGLKLALPVRAPMGAGALRNFELIRGCVFVLSGLFTTVLNTVWINKPSERDLIVHYAES